MSSSNNKKKTSGKELPSSCTSVNVKRKFYFNCFNLKNKSFCHCDFGLFILCGCYC